ncbi:SWIM zinc finger family protein [Shigella flexneri K-227]|uniref:SWIM zinc finger family protein n=1 Tax=Shigella flexneri K-227 TaxID=766147 RepID=F5NX06_SHIFL|nr:SWIM zinc finger family protein [Shigella flexneri K-272]EGK36339.1 SWIM zinc finger family protein [Shigella flexneri K-227]
MNSLRPELLELTPQALTALSNAGFVKRSLKELENGNVPEISHENSALIATFSDGVRTQLANGQALKEAQCTCGASGMCRHHVMLVLSYQRLCATAQPTGKEEEWDPAIWLEELATLPDATRKRAQALVAKSITIELFCAPGEIPSARLPMCVFIPAAVFVSPVVIVLKAHFANMSYWQYRPLSRQKRSKRN